MGNGEVRYVCMDGWMYGIYIYSMIAFYVYGRLGGICVWLAIDWIGGDVFLIS